VLRRILQALFSTKDTTPLRERIEDVEKAMRRLQEDWTETYGKFRTLQLRVAKQVQRIEEDEAPPTEEAQGAGSDATMGSPAGASLSPRQRQVQNEILMRRRRGVPAITEKRGE